MTNEGEGPRSVGIGDDADEVETLLERNRDWATARVRSDPEAFSREAAGQKPPFLFVGCVDSRMPLDVLTRTGPGQLFIHRNIANLLTPGDPAADAVLEFALGVLRVRHLIVCGHTGCGGVAAALQGLEAGAVGRWIAPVRELAGRRSEELAGVTDPARRQDRLAELNTITQLENALRSDPVRRRLREEDQPLHLHAWLYRVETGFLDPLVLPETAWRAGGLLP